MKSATGKEFKINDYLSLRFESNSTSIYVKGRRFNQCSYLLLDVPLNEANVDEIDSIDEAAEKLDRSLEYRSKKSPIKPETEFWGHCSNLQAWAEHEYDTRLLHRNLAFPLLKALSDAHDPCALRMFKEEIARRFETQYTPVLIYLIKEGYLNYLDDEQIETLFEETFDPELYKLIKKTVLPRRNFVVLEQLLNKEFNVSDWIRLADSYIYYRDYSSAINVLMGILESNPNSVEALKRLANNHYFLENEERALSYYLQVLKQSPSHLSTWRTIAHISFKLEYFRFCRKVCIALLKRFPGDIVPSNLLVDIGQMGDRKASILVKEKVARIFRSGDIQEIVLILNDQYLKFIELEQLETLFKNTDIEQQALLKKINDLINRKRIINKMKDIKHLTINPERRSRHSDF